MERSPTPRTRPGPSRRGAGNRKAIGLIAAGTTAVASIVVFAIVLTSGSGSTLPERAMRGESPLSGTLGINQPRMQNTVGIANTKGLHLEFADRDDPTRLSHVVDFGSVEPQRGAQFAVEDASAWIYMDDGRTVHVEAPRGQVIMPDRQDLQSGTFFDGVIIRVFEPKADGSRPTLDADPPALVARTPTLAFDLPRSTAAAKQRLVVEGERVDFIGSDVLIVFDERDQTIRRLEVGIGERLAYRPPAAPIAPPREHSEPSQASSPTPPPSPNPARTTAAPSPLTVATAPPRNQLGSQAEGVDQQAAQSRPREEAEPVVFYHALVRGNVVLTQRSRVIRGDQIDVWARTVGGSIPDDAFGPIDSAQQARAVAPSPRSPWTGGVAELVAASALALAEQSSRETDMLMPVRLESDDEVELEWDGRLVLVPVDERPEVLSARNQLHVRMTDVGGDGLVELEDGESGAFGRCATVDYAATIQEIELTGPGARAVKLELPDNGTIEGQRVTLGLSDSVARVVGPGRLLGVPDEQDVPARRVTWTELARFEMTPTNGETPTRIERALFVGEVEASEQDATLNGGRLVASFRQTDANELELADLDVRGGVEVGDGAGAEVRARRMLASFVPSESTDQPNGAGENRLGDQLTFIGDVFVKRDSTELQSRVLDAEIVMGEDDTRRIGRIDARDGVRFERKTDRLLAISDRLTGDPEQERVELTGDFVLLSQGTSRIRATQAVLDGAGRTMEVFGEGVYEQVDEAGQPEATVVWSDGMVVDDEAGTLECSGAAFARWRAGPDGLDDISAERISVTYASGEQSSEPLAFERTQSGRQITTIVARGGELVGGGGRSAVVQSLRESGTVGDRSLERLFRLEGPEIIADNTTGVLRVEHPGRLVLADLRPDGLDGQASAPTPSDPGTVRGSALFDWTGSMVADRAAGTVLMIGDVRMTHARLADGLRTDLRSERLLARFRETQSRDSELSPFEFGPQREDVRIDLDLASVTGEGSVSLLSGARELLADRLDYDAETGLVEANAFEGGRVSLFDRARVSPIRARGIIWNLATDRIDISRPDPFIQPR